MATIECTVVTPEKTELTTQADSIIVPMFDGLLGILPGRSPMIGRLGFGLLKVKSGGLESTYYVDGGFVQVNRQGVCILTDRMMKPEAIDGNAVAEELRVALAMPADSPEKQAIRDRAVTQARATASIAGQR
ncbi:MAG: FoF1 ATP synthase subunit delta/epsilon [Pirellulaceae bacterium]